MVIVGETGPVHVSKFDVSDSNGVYNGEVADVIMWMDHRATKEAEEINGTHHSVLDFVGGRVSVEMQVPKLLWFKRVLHSFIITYIRRELSLIFAC